MARFLLSPGVITREVDNSQYTSTTPTGNVAAVVGYAEKGPFEPRIVSGIDEFVKVYGKTLADVPYLAQAAYKYFTQGSNLLVVRAGDDRDPDIYPQAAQYASKKIRLGERDLEATKALQTFTKATAVAGGTFAPGAQFGFKVVADNRAFLAPKAVETWDIVMHETANGLGVPTPAGDTQNFVAKIGYSKLGDKTFEANFKQRNNSGNSTEEQGGTGSKSGEKLGDTMTATVYSYMLNGVYNENRNRYTYVSGKYGAAVLGTANMASGHDWTTAQELRFELGPVTYSLTLDAATASASDVVILINTKLATAANFETGAIVDLSGDLEAFAMMPRQDGLIYVGMRRKAAVVAQVTVTSFKVLSSPAASTLGWTAKEYFDSQAVYGTYNTKHDTAGMTFDGNVLFIKKGVETGVESFEEPIDVILTAPASGDWALENIRSQINTILLAGHTEYINNPARAVVSIDATSGKIKLESKDTAASGYKSIVRIKNTSSNSLIDLLGVDMPVDGLQERPVGESLITLRAAEKGSYGNKLVLKTETKKTQTGPSTMEEYHNVYVILDGKEVSVYQRINWDNPTSDKYIPKILEKDYYIRMEAEDEDGNFVYKKLPDGLWALGNDTLPDGVANTDATIVDYTVGTNGWTESQEDGTITSMDADFIAALKKIYNPEVYDFNLVAAPGGAASSVQNEIQNLCEFRHDCFGIIDAAPFGLGLGVKEGLNHVAEINAMNENLTSSYVGAYWPWLQDYDADNKQYIWLPPSIYALTQMVYTDNIADPWYAAAGLNRGKITALDVEYSPSTSERDILYGDTNIINPIVKFVGEGIAIWGQKTAQRTKSALDRINVRRLMIYAEKLIAKMARGFLFEQHDAANWAAFARQANAILEPIRQRRGLYQYQVVCDASTNTDDLINQNIMAGKIFVQPTKTIEYIEVEFTINAAGDVSFTE